MRGVNRHLAALLALAGALPGGAMTLGDYRAGKSRFWLSGGVNKFTFDRRTSPAFFWASTAANAVLIVALTLVCAVMLVQP